MKRYRRKHPRTKKVCIIQDSQSGEYQEKIYVPLPTIASVAFVSERNPTSESDKRYTKIAVSINSAEIHVVALGTKKWLLTEQPAAIPLTSVQCGLNQERHAFSITTRFRDINYREQPLRNLRGGAKVELFTLSKLIDWHD